LYFSDSYFEFIVNCRHCKERLNPVMAIINCCVMYYKIIIEDKPPVCLLCLLILIPCVYSPARTLASFVRGVHFFQLFEICLHLFISIFKLHKSFSASSVISVRAFPQFLILVFLLPLSSVCLAQSEEQDGTHWCFNFYLVIRFLNIYNFFGMKLVS
jgi:hypothetical protein